ncbi:MAG TPA: gluconokinase [Acidobacteriaceae bacterium]|nr:gluconokinase [Acidobacteriaceae bacterium]
MIVILMGVTGAGKSAIGHALAQATGWQFADADDFHSAANKAKMHAGIPLTDKDRAPWLEALHAQIVQWVASHADAILACSALKESYRAELTDGVPKDFIRWIYLTGPVEVIRQRLLARQGHYMSPLLLPSQLATLEPPRNAIQISITHTIAQIVQEIRSALAAPAPGS